MGSIKDVVCFPHTHTLRFEGKTDFISRGCVKNIVRLYVKVNMTIIYIYIRTYVQALYTMNSTTRSIP